MPRVALHALTWSGDDGRYGLSSGGHAEWRFRPGDEGVWQAWQAWQAWLHGVTSFAFRGASGSLNVCQEARPRGGRYWYAYHTAGLEETAAALTGGPRSAPSAPADADQADADQADADQGADTDRGSDAALSDASRGADAGVMLLSTKISPPRPPLALVGRERLLAALNAALSTPLTLLSASAGWGKTTLLAAWAREHPCRVAWLSLDALDDDPARFWIAVIAALRARVPGVGAVALALLRSPQPPPLSAIVTALLNDLDGAGEQAAPLLLILDDYQEIAEPAIHESLRFCLEHLPARLRLLISSRVDPDLPLPRLRARGQVVEFLALHVVALHHMGKRAQARGSAARLFALTEQEGVVRVYLDAGAQMAGVLAEFLAAPQGEGPGAPAIPGPYIARLLAAFEREKRDAHAPARVATATAWTPPPSGNGSPAPSALIEPLTRREQEVLRRLADGASNKEIAADLVISLATVKKHVGNLLGKLGAGSRTQAVARARDASLL